MFSTSPNDYSSNPKNRTDQSVTPPNQPAVKGPQQGRERAPSVNEKTSDAAQQGLKNTKNVPGQQHIVAKPLSKDNGTPTEQQQKTDFTRNVIGMLSRPSRDPAFLKAQNDYQRAKEEAEAAQKEFKQMESKLSKTPKIEEVFHYSRVVHDHEKSKINMMLKDLKVIEAEIAVLKATPTKLQTDYEKKQIGEKLKGLEIQLAQKKADYLEAAIPVSQKEVEILQGQYDNIKGQITKLEEDLKQPNVDKSTKEREINIQKKLLLPTLAEYKEKLMHCSALKAEQKHLKQLNPVVTPSNPIQSPQIQPRISTSPAAISQDPTQSQVPVRKLTPKPLPKISVAAQSAAAKAKSSSPPIISSVNIHQSPEKELTKKELIADLKRYAQIIKGENFSFKKIDSRIDQVLKDPEGGYNIELLKVVHVKVKEKVDEIEAEKISLPINETNKEQGIPATDIQEAARPIAEEKRRRFSFKGARVSIVKVWNKMSN